MVSKESDSLTEAAVRAWSAGKFRGSENYSIHQAAESITFGGVEDGVQWPRAGIGVESDHSNRQ